MNRTISAQNQPSTESRWWHRHQWKQSWPQPHWRWVGIARIWQSSRRHSDPTSQLSRSRWSYHPSTWYPTPLWPRPYPQCPKISLTLVRITMAKPTSAFFKAGASLVPSPVTATTSRFFVLLLSMMPLTKTYLSDGWARAKTRSRGQIWSSFCWLTFPSESRILEIV